MEVRRGVDGKENGHKWKENYIDRRRKWTTGLLPEEK